MSDGMGKSEKISPILKWAGGKTQLLDCILKRMPSQYATYYEPFIGGAAVLLNVRPQKAVINDINPQLVNLYRQLINNSEAIINLMKEMDEDSCTAEKYYLNRDRYNLKIKAEEHDAESAALMIWLNKHCFNGLYRVNGNGLFNVPYNNRKNGKSIDETNFLAVANYLQKADISITCNDFEKACEGIQPGDFVYFDSPYVPESITASFTDYTKDGFTSMDHERLAILFKKLDAMGVKVMLSNNDVAYVRELYEGYNIQSIDVKRLINRNAEKRTGKEVLITNY